MIFSETLFQGLSVHLSPAVVIGSNHASLYHKYHALIHALYLETGDALTLQQYCSSVVAFCSDQGVEFGFSKVPALKVQTVLPWIPAPLAESLDPLGDHSLAPGWDVNVSHANAEIDFTTGCWSTRYATYHTQFNA